MTAVKGETIKLPWDSSEYEKWLKQFDETKRRNIVHYLENAISHWHANFEEFYRNAEYSNISRRSSDKEPITSIVFCARGGAAFSCNLTRYYLNNCPFKKLNTLKMDIKNDSQNIRYTPNTLYVFVTYSGNTEEILNSYENLLNNYMIANKNGSKNLPILVITSKPDPATTGATASKRNQIQKKIENVSKDHPNENIDIHLIALPNHEFYRDTHSIQPYLLFSGTLKGISHFFSFNDGTNEKNFEAQLQDDIFEVRKNDQYIDQINTSIIRAAQILEKQMPYIYADSNTGIVAKRMQHVINENAKILTATGLLSDIQHNHIIPWTQGRSCYSIPVFIPSEDEESIRNTQIIENKLSSDQIKLPYFTFGLFKDIPENSKKLFIGLYIADLLSVKLAMLNEVDPSDNSEIYVMKKRYSENSFR